MVALPVLARVAFRDRLPGARAGMPDPRPRRAEILALIRRLSSARPLTVALSAELLGAEALPLVPFLDETPESSPGDAWQVLHAPWSKKLERESIRWIHRGSNPLEIH